jgi:hypothetical protein
MPSETDALLRSIRRQLLVVVLLVGLGVATLAEVAMGVNGYETAVPKITQVIGGLAALSSAFLFLADTFPTDAATHPEETAGDLEE